MISRRLIYTILIVGSLILAFEVFLYTRINMPLVGVRALFAGLGYMLFVFRPNYFPKRVTYLVLGFLLLGIYSAFIATNTVGQPLIRGFTTNIRFFFVGEVFFIYYLLRKSGFSIDHISRNLYKLGYILVAIYYIVHFFKLSLTTVAGEAKTGIATLNKGLIILIAYLNLGRFFREHKIKFLFITLLLISVDQLVDIQRAFLVGFLVVVLLFLFIYRKQPRILIYTLFAVLFMPSLFYLVFTTTNLGTQLQEKFSSVFELFESASPSSSDPSVNIRIYEVETAYKLISQHPITGTGLLAQETLDRLTNNAHFYSSDIGLIGTYMNFGLFGLILFLSMLRVGISELFRIRDATVGYNAYLIYALMVTFVTGMIMWQPSYFLIIFMFIEYQRYKENEDAHTGYTGQL